jgi:inner membrane protein
VATPIGHILAGQVAYRVGSETTRARGRGLAILCALAAVAPDFDFLPGLLVGTPALYHQGVSHSFAAGAVFTLVLALLYRRRLRGIAAPWGILFLAYASHLVLDLFGPDHRAPYGIPLFWPFSHATFLSPITILPGVHHVATTGAPTGVWVSQTLRVSNLMAIAMEIAIVGPFTLLVEIWVRRRRRAARPEPV